jgi:hypothetical protein
MMAILKPICFCAALCAAVNVAQSAYVPDPMSVSKIEAFLIYGQSGKLSPDIAPPSQEIDFWNTMIGEGGAREWTEDILVIVHIEKISGDSSGGVISIKVVDHKSKKVLLSKLSAQVSFGETKTAAKAFTLENIQCTNLDIIIKAGKNSKTVNLPFACGE